jgi:uncharacterized protein (DUF433 family)
MEIAEIESQVDALHHIYNEALKGPRLDPETGKYNKLPSINIQIKPTDIPFEALRQSKACKFVECSVCGFTIGLCTHNPFNITAERHQKLMEETAKARKAMEAEVQAEHPEMKVEVIPMARVKQPIADETKSKMIDMYVSGSTIKQVHEEFMDATVAEITQIIQDAGKMRTAKEALEMAKKLRTPSKPQIEITEFMVKSAVKRYKQGERLTDMAKEFGVPQPDLSAAMKAAGCEIRRGRR